MRSILLGALVPLLGACSTGGAVILGGMDTGIERQDEVVPVGFEDTGVAPAVCINELSPANRGSYLLDSGAAPDWVELHNPEGHDVDLEGWYLSDDLEDPFKVALEGEVDDEDFVVLTGGAGGEDFDFGLDDAGGVVLLTDPWGGGSRVDYGSVSDDFAIARSSDCCTGTGCLEHVWGGTPGESNTED